MDDVTETVQALIRMDPETQQLAQEAVEFIATVAQQKRDIDRADRMIKSKLIGVMGANGVSRFEADGLSVSLIAPVSKPRRELDVEALTRDFPEIAAAYTHDVEGADRAPYVKITVKEG